MRLLSGKEILESVAIPTSSLYIDKFSRDQLQHTAYYLRLGRYFRRMVENVLADVPDELTEGSPYLRFEPAEYIRVWTEESFRLDSTILGILGGVSDTPRLGLALVAGQFVDPLYPNQSGDSAPLEFGLKNESHLPASIRFHDTIAKVCFFDVSDTSGIEVIPGSLADQKFSDRRLHARDAQFRDDS